MSRGTTERKALIAALEQGIRKASAQGVLYSQLVAERLGMNSTDLECLDIIILREPVTAGELAAATGLTTGAITGVVDRLERAGFARRERDPGDRRKVLVRALPAVRAIAPLFEPMQREASAVISDYTDAELALLNDFVMRAHAAGVAATAALRGQTQAAVKRRPKAASARRKGRDAGA